MVTATASTCGVCKRPLDQPHDPTSKDLGGDCLRCMALVGDPEARQSLLDISRTLSAGRVIFFATIKLGETVHAGCLGFTDTIYEFVMAEDQAQVPALVDAWCQKKGIKFDRVASIGVSHLQEAERYSFPEQIIGYITS